MNVILAVTNERFVAETFFSQYYGTSKIVKPEIIQDTPRDDDVFVEWKTVVNDEELTNYVKESTLTSTYNLLYIPYPGLAYIIARERYLNRTDDKFIIATMREAFQTPIISHELYNIILDTKFKLGFSLFTQLFNDMDHNNLLDEEYDVVLDEVREGKIPLVSDNIHSFLTIE